MADSTKSISDQLIQIPEILLSVRATSSGLLAVSSSDEDTCKGGCQYGSCESACQTGGCQSSCQGCQGCEGCEGCEGACMSSCQISSQTPPNVPSFSITSIGSTTVSLYVSVGSCSVFEVYCRTGGAGESGTAVWDKTVNRTSDFSYTITGLEANATYTVNIRYTYNSSTGWCGSQTFTTKSARPYNWAWWSSIASGIDIGVSANEWIAFCDRINEFREYKGLATYGSFVTPVAGTTKISATIVNHAVWAIGAMASGAYSLEVSAGDTITASFFNGLKNYLNSIE